MVHFIIKTSTPRNLMGFTLSSQRRVGQAFPFQIVSRITEIQCDIKEVLSFE